MKKEIFGRACGLERYLRLRDVEALVGLKKSTIYALMKSTPPAFPQSIRLSARAVGWRESDLLKWQAQHG